MSRRTRCNTTNRIFQDPPLASEAPIQGPAELGGDRHQDGVSGGHRFPEIARGFDDTIGADMPVDTQTATAVARFLQANHRQCGVGEKKIFRDEISNPCPGKLAVTVCAWEVDTAVDATQSNLIGAGTHARVGAK